MTIVNKQFQNTKLFNARQEFPIHSILYIEVLLPEFRDGWNLVWLLHPFWATLIRSTSMVIA